MKQPKSPRVLRRHSSLVESHHRHKHHDMHKKLSHLENEFKTSHHHKAINFKTWNDDKVKINNTKEIA